MRLPQPEPPSHLDAGFGLVQGFRRFGVYVGFRWFRGFWAGGVWFWVYVGFRVLRFLLECHILEGLGCVFMV